MSNQQPETVQQWVDMVQDALLKNSVCFGHGCDNALDEATYLVYSAAGLDIFDAPELNNTSLDDDARLRVRAFISQRIDKRLPAAYLAGGTWFAGLPFLSDQRALVPRSPLAELILNGFSPWVDTAKVSRALDLCTGGGCIGLAMAHYFEHWQVDASDVSEQALTLAEENCTALGLEGRVKLISSDGFRGLSGQLYDLIVSNPPYVGQTEYDTLPAEYWHEPKIGLLSGQDGLDFVVALLAQASKYLNPNGQLIVEVGNSDEALQALFPELCFTWLEFSHGGHGVFILSKNELQQHQVALQQEWHRRTNVA